MSQHYIEDLVEDSVRTVAASDLSPDRKLSLIDGLYRFQARFDTGNTLGRLAGVLGDLGFQGGQDYNPPALMPMIAAVMQQADRSGNTALVYHWLAMLVEGLDEYEFIDDLPASFDAFAASADVRSIRDLVIRNGLPPQKPPHPYIRLRSWSSVRPISPPLKRPDIERNAMLRYFADLKSSPETIEAERQRLIKRAEKAADSPFKRLPELALTPLDLHFVGTATRRETLFLFFDVDHDPAPEGSDIRFIIEHATDLGVIAAKLVARSRLITRWQKSQANDMPHFVFNYFFCVPDDHIRTSRAINPLGGWTFRVDQSEKKLREAVEDLFLHWDHAASFRSFHRKPLSDLLLAKGIRDTLGEGGSLAKKWGFFRTDIETMFAFACLGLERGENIEGVVARIDARLQTINQRNPLKEVWTAGVERLRAGEIWFPPELSGLMPPPVGYSDEPAS